MTSDRIALAMLVLLLASCSTYEERPACYRCEVSDQPEVSISHYALAPCDRRKAWLPEKGAIPERTWWRAKRRDEQTIDKCADRHDALRDEVKALLGELRDDAETH